MSSTLTVTNLTTTNVTATNITDGAGTTSTFANINSGSAKAWLRFNGTGTVTINGSFGISSLADNNSGNYTVNFTNNMDTVNYSVSGAANHDSYFTDTLEPTNYLVGSSRLFTYSRGTSNTGASATTDLTFVNASYNGDLA
jgi:hypothetical protein